MQEHGSARHRVLVADAQLLFAETLARALREEHGVDVVPEHPVRGQAALEAVRRHRPDVVIYDNWMLELDGPSAVSAIGTDVPGAKVLVTSGYHGPHHIQAALAAGAAGFLPKSLRVGQLADAVRRAAAGEALVFAEQLADLMDDLNERLEVSRIRTVGLSSLTARELEVLEALAPGSAVSVVAEQLSISVGTLRNHLHNILSKTGARNRVELVAMARREGFVAAGHPPTRERSRAASGSVEGAPSRDGSPGSTHDGRRPASVLIADAQRLFTDALGSALATDPRLSVLPVVATRAGEAIEAMVSHRPDIVVYDLHLQGMEPSAVVRALSCWAPGTRVVLLSWYHGRRQVRRALAAAPDVMLAKSCTLAAVRETVSHAAGRHPSEHAAKLAAVAELLDAGAGGDHLERLLTLTPKELQVLQHLAKGQPLKQAASELALAVGTVKNVTYRLISKLGVRTQLDAVAMARNAGFVCED